MTKTKSKKMTKSTFAIIIMAVVMVAMLAFGGTYAYFTATASQKTGEITTGHVKLSADGEGATITNIKDDVLPGDALFGSDLTLTVDVTGDQGAYVAIKFTITGGTGLSISADSIVAASGNGWYKTGTDNVYIYGSNATTAVAQTATVTVPLTKLVIPTSVNDDWVQGEDTSTGNLMDATISVTLEAKAIQVASLSPTDAVTQLVGLFN